MISLTSTRVRACLGSSPPASAFHMQGQLGMCWGCHKEPRRLTVTQRLGYSVTEKKARPRQGMYVGSSPLSVGSSVVTG
jgi:hypothetical protein